MIHCLKQILKDRTCFAVIIVSSLFLFGIFIMIPVIAIPQNTLTTQLDALMLPDYFILILLALLSGLNFAIPVYSYKMRCAKNNLSAGTAEVMVSGTTGVLGAFIGTTACASCVIPLLTAIGLNSSTALFVLNNSFYFSIAALLILCFSLYWSIKRIQKGCRTC